MPNYSEKKRSLVLCSVCGTSQGQHFVQILDRKPRFVCTRHRESHQPTNREIYK